MSLMTREDVLRELELLPVWQLKMQLPMIDATIPDVDASSTVVAVPAEPVSPDIPASVDVSVSPDVSIAPVLTASVVSAVTSAVIEIPVATVQELVSDEMESSIEEFLPLADEHVELPTTVVAAAPFRLLAFRLLVSEDASFAFVLDDTALNNFVLNDDAQDVETLLQNMLRAINIKCNIDISDANADTLAEHPVQSIIVMGESAANNLLGQTLSIDEWRSAQSDTPLNYQGLPVTVTYHPSFLLKNTAYKANAWLDLCAAKAKLNRPQSS